jgi:hypothetical protein
MGRLGIENRLLSLFSGVNVVPSILLLAVTIPLLFRRAQKNELELSGGRDGKVNAIGIDGAVGRRADWYLAIV